MVSYWKLFRVPFAFHYIAHPLWWPEGGGRWGGNVCPRVPKLVFWEIKLYLWTTALIFKLWSQPKVWAPTSAVNFDRLKSLRPCVSSAPTVNPFFLTFSRENQSDILFNENTNTMGRERLSNGKEKNPRSGRQIWVVCLWGYVRFDVRGRPQVL